MVNNQKPVKIIKVCKSSFPYILYNIYQIDNYLNILLLHFHMESFQPDLAIHCLCNDKIYRIRITNNKQNLNSASEMGTVPIEYALQANRMSPVGIAMFYGAFYYYF